MPGDTKPTKDEILSLEKSYWDAMKEKDGSRTAELSGKTALVTGARGVMVIEKAQMGKMTEEGGWKLHSYKFEDIKFSAPAANVAIIAYTVQEKAEMDGSTKEFRAANSSTWVQGPQGWECHAHSETILPG